MPVKNRTRERWRRRISQEKLSYYFLAVGTQNEKTPVSARACFVRLGSLRGGPPITKFQLIPRAHRPPENFTDFGYKGRRWRVSRFATSRLSSRAGLFVRRRGKREWQKSGREKVVSSAAESRAHCDRIIIVLITNWKFSEYPEVVGRGDDYKRTPLGRKNPETESALAVFPRFSPFSLFLLRCPRAHLSNYLG